MLYDSVGNDLFSTSGDVTSIVGPGFSTFARGFENVEAFSTAGGVDRATIHAPVGGKLTSGSDYIGMQDATRSSIARGFERVETFVTSQSIPTSSATVAISENEAALPEPSDTNALSVMQTVAYQNDVSSSFNSAATVASSAGNIVRESVLDGLDWLNNLVEHEIRILRSGVNALAQTRDGITLDDGINSVDLSWTESSKERSVLDEIFAKHA